MLQRFQIWQAEGRIGARSGGWRAGYENGPLRGFWFFVWVCMGPAPHGCWLVQQVVGLLLLVASCCSGILMNLTIHALHNLLRGAEQYAIKEGSAAVHSCLVYTMCSTGIHKRVGSGYRARRRCDGAQAAEKLRDGNEKEVQTREGGRRAGGQRWQPCHCPARPPRGEIFCSARSAAKQ